MNSTGRNWKESITAYQVHLKHVYCKTPAQFVSRDCFTKEKKQPAGSGKSEDVWSSSVLEKSATVECFQEADLQREGRKTHFHNDRERLYGPVSDVWTRRGWNHLWYCE